MSKKIRMNRRLPRHRTISRREAARRRAELGEDSVTTVAMEVRQAAQNPAWSPAAAYRYTKRARNRLGGQRAGNWVMDKEGNVKMVRVPGGRNRRKRRMKLQSPHLVARRQRHMAKYGSYTRTKLSRIRAERLRQRQQGEKLRGWRKLRAALLRAWRRVRRLVRTRKWRAA